MINQLDHPRYHTRDTAERRLREMRPVAEAFLREALESAGSAEMRFRITRILNQPIQRPAIAADTWRRWHRLVFALELVDSSVARDLLRKIAYGHNHIDISREAVEALGRLENSPSTP
ncbi:MAG: hypothetical protein GTO41_10795 [Burkholderiales bacterium]|nr:hypothetical protein [Burkholderiales bacterium]